MFAHEALDVTVRLASNGLDEFAKFLQSAGIS